MNETNGHSEELSGGSGGISALSMEDRKCIQNTRLIERALREAWPIPEEYKEAIVKRQVSIAIDPVRSPREATSAARCIVSMEQQNQDKVFKALDKIVPDQHEHQLHMEENRVDINKLHEDPSYVEFLRYRTIAADCDSGAVCQIRDAGEDQCLENGTTPSGPGPGTNGHRNGSH